MQVAKLTGSIANTVISDERADSLGKGCCHQGSTHILDRISTPEHSKSE